MIEVISGAPCAGKSTYIRNKAQPGDIIIDLDRIALAITTENTPHHDYDSTIRQIAIQGRKALIAQALTYGQQKNIYIIDTNPSPHSKRLYQQFRATWTRLDTPKETCLQRIKTERPKHLQQTLIEVTERYFREKNNG